MSAAWRRIAKRFFPASHRGSSRRGWSPRPRRARRSSWGSAGWTVFPAAAFRRETGFDYRDLRGNEIDSLCRMGLLEERDGFLRLTEKGLFVSDSVFRELV